MRSFRMKIGFRTESDRSQHYWHYSSIIVRTHACMSSGLPDMSSLELLHSILTGLPKHKSPSALQ